MLTCMYSIAYGAMWIARIFRRPYLDVIVGLARILGQENMYIICTQY